MAYDRKSARDMSSKSMADRNRNSSSRMDRLKSDKGNRSGYGKTGRSGRYAKNDSYDRYSRKAKQNAISAKPAEYQNDSQSVQPDDGIITGRNPVIEALKSGREMTRLMVANGAEGSIKKIVAMARDRNIAIQFVDNAALDRVTCGAAHQGVAAYVSDFEYCEVEDILARAEEKGEAPFIIILDGIEDPHNLGAVIRTADASGAHGVIIPKRRAASVTAVAEKSAAGAAAYVPVARVNNISRTVEELQKAGVWVAATDMDGENYYGADFKGPVALVIGNEGKGISRLVKEKCDFCVSIPMYGGVNSLNASNAAAILMYEAVRQRNIE